jgi:hypothetical protein
MYWENYKHLLEQIVKNIVPKFIRMKKKIIGKKTWNPFLK